VYCFWDPVKRSVLYIGISVDLPLRFRKHNGIGGHGGKGNKREQIDAHFRTADYLGYSLLLQSPMAQPLSARALLPFGADAPEVKEAYGDLVEHGEKSIRHVEGLWIEAHRQTFGAIPPWNQMGGQVSGRVGVTPATKLAFEVMTGQRDSLIAARHTLERLRKSLYWKEPKPSFTVLDRSSCNWAAATATSSGC
jgi:hypothetical protein